MVDSKNWFKSWFDSPYYHLLYDKRDENEAKLFLNRLIDYLKPKKGAKILDLACGKGRHSIYLNQMGFDVLGVDLSEESILYAKEFENIRLHFLRADMRNLDLKIKFDLTLNLFTSFGYFIKEEENINVIHTLGNLINSNGYILIDYLNCHKAIKDLPKKEEIIKNDIKFTTRKTIDNGFIVKEISFFDKNKEFVFKEFVKLIDFRDFEKYFNRCGLEIKEYFGDYLLNSYDQENSDRLIILAKKK